MSCDFYANQDNFRSEESKVNSKASILIIKVHSILAKSEGGTFNKVKSSLILDQEFQKSILFLY